MTSFIDSAAGFLLNLRRTIFNLSEGDVNGA